MKNNRIEYNGVGFLGALTIALIVLKLCGVIAWSWAWVLAPLWIPLAAFVAIIIIALIIGLAIDD